MMLTMSRGKDTGGDDSYKRMYEESVREVRDLEKHKTVVCYAILCIARSLPQSAILTCVVCKKHAL